MAARTFPISAREAMAGLQQLQKAMNKSRVIPETPAMLKEFSRENTVHIWNIGPWDHIRECGSAGTFRVPKCEKGEAYGGPLSIPGLVEELIPVDEQHFELRQEPGGGRYLAEQIIGLGMMLRRQDALVKYGVFISEEIGFLPDGKPKPPAQKELAAAREALLKHYQDLVVEAREAASMPPTDPRYQEVRGNIGERHYQAARELNLPDEPWLMASNPVGRKKCQWCSVSIDPDAAVCPNCKNVVDAAKYAAMKAAMKG